MITRIPLIALVLVISAGTGNLLAVSPESVTRGRQLFERDWTPGNPQLGSDGLGPLFNGQSCVACHHQGGVGGGGDARFNAKTVGIERMEVTGGLVDNDIVASLLRTFHRGFISSSGTISNTVVLAHHGGSPAYQSACHEMMANVDSVFSGEGGSSDASEVRRSLATPILFNNKVGLHEVLIRARLFQRNTSPLFGLGLIDEITGKQIEEQVRLQKQHPEISGRPATLKDGRYGRFGWRGNVATLLEFVDQACAAEVGLETKRKDQPRDPTRPDYRNTSVDIKDQQIIAMRDFIASLPAPVRNLPTTSAERQMAIRGDKLFASVGCAVCHVPNLGPAKGIYSDILLHDMGYESMDLNHADPYIIRATPASRVTVVSATSRATGMGSYYGRSAQIDTTRTIGEGNSSSRRRKAPRAVRNFRFVAPTGPLTNMEILPMGHEDFAAKFETKTDRVAGMIGEFTVRTEGTMRRHDYMRLHYQPTNFNQEWRTPPLWGLRDSAPYMHDGRAETVLESIAMHDGEAAGSRDRFLQLSVADRQAVLAFLGTLVAPPSAPQQAN